MKKETNITDDLGRDYKILKWLLALGQESKSDMKKSVLFLLAFCLFPLLLLGDVAPIRHETFNITPIDAKGVSLDSADVDITWGDPCKAKAVFHFSNNTEKEQNIHVGFPILLDAYQRGYWEEYNYEISINGSKAEKLGLTKHKASGGSGNMIEWYGQFVEFPLGASTITVTYNIPPSYSDGLPFRKTIHYFLSTGSSWEGKIRKERVTVHFPYGVDERQVEKSTTPDTYEVKDKSIAWIFSDFEPSSKDDINLEILDPRAYDDLEEIEELYAKYPNDHFVKLSLIKHYFALGRSKGYGLWAPYIMKRKQYEDIVSSIKNETDREFVAEKFKEIGDDSLQCQIGDERDRKKLADILLQADYAPYHARSLYVDKAKELIEEHLEDNPNDEYAWLVYIRNYYRFKFRGYPYGKEDRQKRVIEEALSHCPDSVGLKLWKAVFEGEEFSASELGAYLRRIGIMSGTYSTVK